MLYNKDGHQVSTTVSPPSDLLKREVQRIKDKRAYRVAIGQDGRDPMLLVDNRRSKSISPPRRPSGIVSPFSPEHNSRLDKPTRFGDLESNWERRGITKSPTRSRTQSPDGHSTASPRSREGTPSVFTSSIDELKANGFNTSQAEFMERLRPDPGYAFTEGKPYHSPGRRNASPARGLTPFQITKDPLKESAVEDSLLNDLNKQMKERLQFKCNSRPLELLKCFKHFDPQDTGMVDEKRFSSVLRLCGIELQEHTKDIFSRYKDDPHSETVDYENLVKKLMPQSFQNEALGGCTPVLEVPFGTSTDEHGVPEGTPTRLIPTDRDNAFIHKRKVTGVESFERDFSASMTDMPIKQLEKVIRDKVQARMKGGPYEMRRSFKHFDRDASGAIDESEFGHAMKVLGVYLNDDQLRRVFRFYDKDDSGEIDYSEFVKHVITDFTTNDVLGPTVFENVPYAADSGHPQAIRDPRTMASKSFLRRYAEIKGQDEYKDTPGEITELELQNIECQVRDKIQAHMRGGPFQLRRAFKQFDESGKGEVSKKQFATVLERKFGINLKENQVLALFDRYDTDKNGTIDYNEFVTGVVSPDFAVLGEGDLDTPFEFDVASDIARTRGSKVKDVPFKGTRKKETIEAMLSEPPFSGEDWPTERVEELVRSKIQSRTKGGPYQIRKAFKYFDRDASGDVDREEFHHALRSVGVDLTAQQLHSLFDSYDTNKDGRIDYHEFVHGLVEKDFPTNKVMVGISPTTKERQRNKEQDNERGNYTRRIETIHDIELSAKEAEAKKDFFGRKKMKEIEQILKDKIQARVGGGQFQLRRAFKLFDPELTGGVNKTQFTASLKSLGIELPDSHEKVLFDKYDANKDGKLDYNEFVKGVMPKEFDLAPSNDGLGDANVIPPFDVRISTLSTQSMIVEGNNRGGAAGDVDPSARVFSERTRRSIDRIREIEQLQAEEPAPKNLSTLEHKVRRKIEGKNETSSRENHGVMQMIQTFQFFDRTGTGVVPLSKFKEAMVKSGIGLSDRQADALFRRYESEEGLLDYHNFVLKMNPRGDGRDNLSPLGPATVHSVVPKVERPPRESPTSTPTSSRSLPWEQSDLEQARFQQATSPRGKARPEARILRMKQSPPPPAWPDEKTSPSKSVRFN